MAKITIDDRELVRLFEIIRSYEAVVAWLMPEPQEAPGKLCIRCKTTPRIGYRYCASCKTEIQQTQVRRWKAKRRREAA